MNSGKNSTTRFSSQQLRDFYRGQYVHDYHQQDKGRLRRVLQKVAVSSQDSVTDLACGNGLLLAEFATLPKRYVGVDFSSEFIAQAKLRFKNKPGNVEFVCQDLIDFAKHNPKQFDWAFTLDFSEHIYDDQFLEIYKEIAKTLKKSGQLVLHTPNADFFIERLKANNFLLKQFPEHVAVRKAGQYEKLLKKAGYKRIKVHYLPHYHPFLAWLEIFQDWPILNRFLRARLLIIAQAS